MSDTISRKAAISLLKKWSDGYQYIETETELAIKEFQGLPSVQTEQRWIPCNWQTKEENLPRECKSVLICMKDSCGYRIGVSYRTDYNRWEGYGRVNVIAWMPLPEPYAERRIDETD